MDHIHFISLLIYCFLFFILLQWAPCQGQTIQTAKFVDKVCLERIKMKYPQYKARFKEALLNRSCEKSRVWKDDAIKGKRKAASDRRLTRKQMDYFNSVSACKGIHCLCDQWDTCKQVVGQLKQIKQTFGGLGDLGEKLKSGGLDDLFKEGKRKRRQVDFNAQINLLQKFGKITRKEIRTMTDDERRKLFMVLNTLKTEKVDGWSKFDILIIYHTPEYAPEAHFGAAFLPFHREFLKNTELAMRMVDPTVSLPYWDSTLDTALPNPADSVLWTDDFFGPGNGEVTSGPFGNWTTIPDQQIPDLSPRKKIVRGVGQSPFGSTFKESDVQTIMAKPAFRNLVFCVDPFLELVHGATHMFVGGHMIELRISPNDPVFFFIHTWVDLLWENWRQSRQNANQRENDFVADNETCNEFSKINSMLKPYQVTLKDGMSNKYVDEFYAYEPRATCPSCHNSPYLFCDTANSRCMSKIRQNGNCTGYDGKDVCYRGTCTRGICVPSANPTQPVSTNPTTTPTPSTTTTRTTTAAATTTTTSTRTTAGATSTPIASSTPPTNSTPPFKQATGNGTTGGTPATPPTAVIVPVTVPAKNGTQPNVPATVWFPVTVLLSQKGNASASYPKATVRVQASDGKVYEGAIAKADDQPYYTGAAYGQIHNPFSKGGVVQGTVGAFDEFGKPCTSLCLQGETNYVPCQPSLTLDTDPAKSDKIPTTPNLALAKLLNWKGYHRSLDKFMFVCDTPGAVPGPTGVLDSPGAGSSNMYNISLGGGKFINIVTKNNAANQIANGGCHNLHRCCALWADVGECKRNKWMQVACEWACHVCNPGENITVTECCDYHPKCPNWALAGQCATNPSWMEENCKESCKVCSRNMDDLSFVCGVPKKGSGCKNYHNGCDGWAKDGECDNNPWWMKENCPMACKKCNVTTT